MWTYEASRWSISQSVHCTEVLWPDLLRLIHLKMAIYFLPQDKALRLIAVPMREPSVILLIPAGRSAWGTSDAKQPNVS
jgi:hypothetical protein